MRRMIPGGTRDSEPSLWSARLVEPSTWTYGTVRALSVVVQGATRISSEVDVSLDGQVWERAGWKGRAEDGQEYVAVLGLRGLVSETSPSPVLVRVNADPQPVVLHAGEIKVDGIPRDRGTRSW